MTINDVFSDLLIQYMRRIRASAAGVAAEIGLSREAVNNWRNGYSRPSKRHRDKLVACANYLRLTEEETNGLLAAAGFEPEYLSATTDNVVAQDHAKVVLEKLGAVGSYPIMLLLSQASWGQLPIRDELLAQARHLYGAEKVLHIRPPYSLSTDAAEYFGALGMQCDFGPTDSDFAFEGALLQQLQRRTEPLFVMVSRFEQGLPELRTQLAGILRSLSEENPGRLHLLLCGGEQLAELKYAGGDLSLLNIAVTETWPELTVSDVQRLAQQRGLAITTNAVTAIHSACGGHNGLVATCLDMATNGHEPTESRWDLALAEHEQLWEAVIPLARNAAERQRLTSFCAEDVIGSSRPYLVDPLLRGLYWRNLITNRVGAEGSQLQWRCSAIRNAVSQVLAEWPAA